jgi:hypothetical protein
MKKALAVAGIGAALLGGALLGTGTASADTGAAFSYPSSASADATFYDLLTTGSDVRTPMSVWNFPLVRAQGLEACQRWSNGATLLDPIYNLMAEGPYSFDQANTITSSAATAYCEWAFNRAARIPLPAPPPPPVVLPPNYSDGD